MNTQTRDNKDSAATDCSAVCPGFSSIYEWIDYWQAGNTQHESDKLSVDDMRADLAWASQTISHMLASLRDIVDCQLEAKPDYSDAVQIAKNAIAEYGLK